MSGTAVILLVISAFTHSGWNLIGKRYRPEASLFVMAVGAGAILLSPFLVIHREVLSAFTAKTWGLLLTAGLFQALYYASLTAAYRSGELSLVYPVARSTPAVLVAVFGLLAGRADSISPWALLGIAFVVGGGYLLPMRHSTDLARGNYLRPSFLLALSAAVGTAGYSIADDAALGMLWRDLELTFAEWQVATVYAFFECSSTTLCLLVFVVLSRRERLQFRRRLEPRSILFAFGMGAVIYLTYTLVLISLAFVRDVSYVVAFRQLSVPLGVLMSAMFLHETLYPPKVVGTILMFAGVILVGLG